MNTGVQEICFQLYSKITNIDDVKFNNGRKLTSLSEVVADSKQNTTLNIGCIDWKRTGFVPGKNTVFYLSSDWATVGIDMSGMIYTLNVDNYTWSRGELGTRTEINTVAQQVTALSNKFKATLTTMAWKEVNIALAADSITTVYSFTIPSDGYYTIDLSALISMASVSTDSYIALSLHKREYPDSAEQATEIFPNNSISPRMSLFTSGNYSANQVMDIRIRTNVARTCKYVLARVYKIY